jgi:hypothetical protein
VDPPPDTTPPDTVRFATGALSLVEARPSRTCLAYAAAARICVERAEMPELPLPPPVTLSHDSGRAYHIWLKFMFISSATIIRIPVGVP